MPHKSNITQIGWTKAVITAKNITKDGSIGTVHFIFGPVKMSVYIDRIRWVPHGANDASVARIFVNNGGLNTDAQNNSPLPSESLPSTTLSETAKMNELETTMNLWLPAGYRIFVTLGTDTVGGWSATCIAGQYSTAVSDIAAYRA